MVVSSSSGLNANMTTLVAKAMRLVWPWWQHGPQTPTWPQVADQTGAICKQPSVVTRAMDIKSDPCCCQAMNPDMVLGSSLGLDVTIVPGDSAGHSN